MTLDKFNRHLYQHDDLLLVERLASITCDVIFYIGALRTDENGLYRIINSEVDPHTKQHRYIFPLEKASVHNATWIPETAKMFINNKPVDIKSLVGRSLHRGDRINFSGAKNDTSFLLFQAVLSVPVTPNRI